MKHDPLHYWLVQSGKDMDWLEHRLSAEQSKRQKHRPGAGNRARKEDAEPAESRTTFNQNANMPVFRYGCENRSLIHCLIGMSL